ncbi:condensation domain-containing protein [Actinophytocola sediminis]
MRLANLSDSQRDALDRLLADRGLPVPARETVTRRADRTGFPLSYAQQRIWFFDRLQPGSTLYNIAGSARLTGRVDVDVLRASLDEVVRRHEVLRTTYHLADNRPVQRVNPPRPVSLPVVDLSEVPAPDQEARLRAVGLTEAARPFDLERDQFLRPLLVRFGPRRHVLVLCQHHIATDGWSLGVLLTELGAIYRAFAANRPSPLPELSLQYGDFAAWQREWLTGSTLDAQLDYWRDRLAGAPLLDLPAGRPQPNLRSWDGDSVPCRLPAPLVRRLRELGESAGATLYMVLVAAFAVVVSRWSAQDDVVVGAPVANRNRAEIEGMIGCFVNTLPLRLRVAPETSFRELLAGARQACLDGYANQDVPFDRIIEAVNPERTASAATPIVRHMFGLHNTAPPALDLPELEVELAGLDTGKARFDLEFELYPDGEAIDGFVWFAVELFTRPMVARIVDGFTAVLAAVADRPDTPVAALPVAAGTGTEPTAGHDTDPLQAVADTAAAAPAAVAVEVAGEQVTRAALAGRVGRLTHLLLGHGVGPERPVVVCLPPSADQVAALLAVLAAGGVYVAVDRPELLAEVAGETGAELVVTLGTAESAGYRVCLLDRETLGATAPARPADLGATAVLTRAADRWLVVTRAGLAARIGQLAADQLAADTVVVASSPAGDAWPAEVLCALGAGARLVLPAARDTGSLRRLLADHPAAVACLPSTTLAGLLGPGLPAARIAASGEPPSAWLTRAAAASVSFRYGPAIAPTAIATGGVPAAGVRIAVLDERGRLVPDGVCGELCVGGPAAAPGFWGQSEATAAALVPDPAHPGERLLRTGELATYAPEEGVRLLGPVTDRVPVNGHAAATGQVRAALETHPAVVAALANREPDGTTVAHVQLAAPQDPPDDRSRFEQAYLERPVQEDPALNLSGWTSPHSGAYLAEDAMRDWAQTTAARVLDLAPKRVIEVGCRTGTLLFRLAPRCVAYWGVDPSANALAHIEQHRDWLAGRTDAVRLLRHAPDHLADIEDDTADLVVVNSLTRYFPSVNYLCAVLEEALRVVAPGGAVLLTDLRSWPLELAARTADLLDVLPPETTEGQLCATAAVRAQAEPELLLDPAGFATLVGDDRFAAITGVSVLPRTGRRHDELSAGRFDVLLRTGTIPAEDIDWADDPDVLRTAGDRLVGLRGIPDARLARRSRARLAGRHPHRTIGQLPPDSTAGADPADLAEMAAAHGRRAEFTLGAGGADTLDVVFVPAGAASPALCHGPVSGTLRDHANDPGRAADAARTVPVVQAHLRAWLTEHQLPAQVIPVTAWPVGPDDRIDPALLPVPVTASAGAGLDQHEEPRTELERVISTIWSEVLGIEQLGVRDDFFALGGHSLMGAEVVDRIREVCDVDVPLGQLFAAPTIAEVAAFAAEAKAGAEPAAAPIRRVDRSKRRVPSRQEA